MSIDRRFTAYTILCDLDERGKTNLVFNVRHFLNAHGFMYVWNTQSVGSIHAFLAVLMQRRIECRWQCLDLHIQTL